MRKAALLLLLATSAPAQQMDELSSRLLEEWAKKEYRLSRAGAKECSFDISATVTAMTGKLESRGDFFWDGKKGRLHWERPAVGRQLAYQGWTKESWDADLVPGFVKKQLAGCKLTAKKEKSRTVVTVAGENHQAWRYFIFDEKGMLKRLVIDGKTPQGRIKKDILFTWKKFGTKYLATGWTFTMTVAMQELEGKAKATYGKVGAFHVMTRYEETVTRKGKTWSGVVLEFHAHRVK